jgi:hypothetical protein
MPSPLEELVDLVAMQGMPRERAETITCYVADRSVGLSLSTVHSSARSALRHDPFLLDSMALTQGQIRAWLALVRGTRAVRRANGKVVGGCPGFVEARLGEMTDLQLERFRRLARTAARARPSFEG